MISCDDSNDNCIGGTAGNDVCREGHIGPLCEECDVNYQLKLFIIIKI